MFIEIRVHLPKEADKDYALEVGEYLKDFILDNQELYCSQPEFQVTDVTYEVKENE